MRSIYCYWLDRLLPELRQGLTKPISAPTFILSFDNVNSAPDDLRTDSSWYGRLGGFVFCWGAV